MRVLVMRVGENAQVVEIGETVEDLQKLVGGYFEELPLGITTSAYFDEDGLSKRLPVNRHIEIRKRGCRPYMMPIVGTIVLVECVYDERLESYRFDSMSDEDVQFWTAQFENWQTQIN